MKHYPSAAILAFVECLGLATIWSCYMSKTRYDRLIQKSRLYQDLYLDHRDTMYRAMTFIARNGGPLPAGDTKEVLAEHRERDRDWLLVQEKPGDFLAAYEHFLQSWSPVFKD